MPLLTEDQLDTLTKLRDEGPRNDNYSHVYEQIAEWLEGNPAASSVRLWFLGAEQANGGYGPFSQLIRAYTERQAELRGVAVTEALMQEASNLVATNVIGDLLAYNELTLEIIARNDATAVGSTVFKDLVGDTVFTVNAGWSGSVLFTMLGGNEIGRLYSAGNAGTIDTLDDWKNIIIAYDAFVHGIRAISPGEGTVDGMFIFNQLPDASWTALFSDVLQNWSGTTDYELGPRIARLFEKTPLGQAFHLLSNYGVAETLNMLFSAFLGRPDNSVTEENYAESLKAIFQNLLPVQTQETEIDFLGDLTAAQLEYMASDDIRVRNALASLSVFALDPLDTRAAELALYDLETGDGAITEAWMRARSAYLEYLNYERDRRDDDRVVNDLSRFGGDLLFKARAGGTDLDLRVDRLDLGVAEARRIYFGAGEADLLVGGQGDDVLFGEGGDDSLTGGTGDDYLEGGTGGDLLDGGDDDDILIGMSGNDTLIGGRGNDRMEGGTGFDRYEIGGVGEFNQHDTIVDLDGAGELVFGGVTVGAMARLGEDAWESADGRFRALRNSTSGSTTITVIDTLTQNSVELQGWQQGGLGLQLEGLEQAFTPGPANTTTMWDGDLAPDGSVPINGIFEGSDVPQGFFTGFGNDVIHAGSANDYINGGSGSDTIEAGDGNDVIVEVARNLRRPSYWIGPTLPGTVLAEGLGFIISLLSGDGQDARTYFSDISIAEVWQSSPGSPGGQSSPDPELYADGGDIIDAGAGSDIVMSGEGNDIVNGGSGNDVIFGGHDNDLLLGGQGDDFIRGDLVSGTLAISQFENLSSRAVHDGNDQIDGGDGNDEIYGDGGSDQIWGGQGDDKIVGDEVLLDASRQGSDTLYGGDGNDRIWGGAGDELISGDAGDDVIYGDFTQDHLALSNHGNDRISGGDGADFVDGQGGNDHIDGGNGNDTLVGGAGDDMILGGAGTDFIWGDSESDAGGDQGQDTIDAGAGDDVVHGMGGDDILVGGEGNDWLYGDNGTSSGEGADLLYGGAGDDFLHGGGGNDELQGGAGNDVMIGGRGDDLFVIGAGEGHDIVGALADAEAGSDLIRLTSAGTDTTKLIRSGDDLVINLGPDQTVTLEGFFTETSAQHRVEFADGSSYDRAGILALMGIGGTGNDYLVGGAGDDELLGNEGHDYLEGLAGNDRLIGGEGDDTLLGGNGNDLLDGGSGNDDLRGGEGQDTYRFDVNSGHDTIDDSDSDSIIQLGTDIDLEALSVERQGDDALLRVVGNPDWSLRLRSYFAAPLGSAPPILLHDGRLLTQQAIREAVLQPSAGDDSLIGYETDDILSGGEGNDYISGRGGNDIIDGGEGNDSLYGNEGDDTLTGGDGDDFLFGDEGHNTLHGGEGNDVLDARNGSALMDGGAGEDTLSGSDQNDTYVFNRGNQGDWVRYGTSGGTDTLRLGPDITLADLEFVLDTNMFTGLSMSIRIKGTDDVFNIYTALDVTGESVVGTGEIERVEFADGTVMSAADFHAHVVAHAVLSGAPEQARVGSAADEVLLGGDSGEWIYGMGGNDHITGGAGGDNIRAGLGDDVVNGGAGDDMLRGGAGDDHLHGGAGNDTLLGGYGNDSFYFNAGDGWDSIADAWAYGSPYDDLDGDGFDRLYLGEGLNPADVVVTRDDQNRLTMHFIGKPEDRIQLDNQLWYDEPSTGAVDEIIFADGTVWTTQDLLTRVDSVPEVAQVLPPAVALAGKSFSYTFPADLFTDNGPLTWEVLNYPEWLQYDTATRTLSGLVPNDWQSAYGIVIIATDSFGQRAQTYMNVVWAAAIEGTGQNDTLTGTANADALFGHAGNDRLDGRGGGDFMYGGTGDDAYTVDHADDQAIELAGEGTDTVSSAVTFTLGDHVENLTLTGSRAINATGNSEANVIRGNDQANSLWGMAGNDTLDGGYGDDHLFGGAGNDELNGGWGSDVLEGGEGDDIYILNSEDDLIIESADGGIDLVKSSALSYTLADNVENLLTTNGGEATGNSLANTMTGDTWANRLFGMAGDDILDGKGGQDELHGGVGSDTYILGSGFGSDTLVETASNAGDHDIARFTLATYDQLWLTREIGSNDLTIAVLGGQNLLVVRDWFLGEEHHVESFEAGGRVLQAADVDELMEAMEQTGKTNRSALTTAQKLEMKPIWDAVWKPQGTTSTTSSAELASLVSAMSQFGGDAYLSVDLDDPFAAQRRSSQGLMAEPSWHPQTETVTARLL